jgi:hypothetical protein
MLREAAAAQDWDPIVCDSAEEALRQVARHRLQMVMVDLEVTGRRTPDSFKDMTERLAGESERLLILCGNEGDAAEEIWARQLAAWMYLPGVDDQSDVAMVCGEAKNVAQKLMDSKAAHEAPA